jgi:hypothetical protein
LRSQIAHALGHDDAMRAQRHTVLGEPLRSLSDNLAAVGEEQGEQAALIEAANDVCRTDRLACAGRKCDQDAALSGGNARSICSSTST